MIAPLAQALTKLGHEVYVLDISPWGASKRIAKGIHIHTAATRKYLLRNPRYALAIVYEEARNRLNGSWYSVSVEERRPRMAHLFLGNIQRAFAADCRLDVLQTFGNTNIVGLCNAELLNRLVTVVNFVGFGIDPKRGGFNSFPYQPYIFERPFWDLHIAATDFEFMQYKKVYEAIGLPVEQLMWLPHCYYEDLFRPLPAESLANLRMNYDLDKSQLVLLYPVQVYPRKNVELAIDIVARIPKERDPVLIVPGQIFDQQYAAKLVQQSKILGLGKRVRFLKGIPHREMVKLFNVADVTIFPSHQETFGLGLVESLGCGTPVIGPSYIHPCREILNGSYGGLVADKDPESFYAAILLASDIKFDHQRIARDARKRYGNKTVAIRWLERVQELRRIKLAQQDNLANIDWRGLYQDDLDLSKEVPK